MTINGSAQYGSICGFIFTCFCTGLIIGSMFYKVQLFFSDSNYFGTM
jgi:hypothetical protein